MLAYFSLTILVLGFSLVVLNVFWAPRLEVPRQALTHHPLVSVLIPARNEAHQIEACIQALQASHYPNFEILIADDDSTDATAQLASLCLAKGTQPGRVLAIMPGLPEAWLGKARACQTLADAAQGEILIFCDADVIVGADALKATVAYFQLRKAEALSALPLQSGGTLFSRAVAAVISQFSIFIALPLPLVPYLASASLSAGNGQWLAFRRELYDNIGGHEAVKSSRIEDVHLARLAKTHGGKLFVVLAAKQLKVKMYASFQDARLGFRKNLFPLLGNSWIGLMGCEVLLLCGAAAPLFAAGEWGLTAAILIFCLQMLTLILFAYRQKLSLSSWLFLPLAFLVTPWLLLESAIMSSLGRVQWKDRIL